MGKNESKPRKINKEKKIALYNKIKREFNCPLCNKKFTGNMTYLQLNQHLFRCGNFHSKPGTSLNMKINNNFSFNGVDIKPMSENSHYNKNLNANASYILKNSHDGKNIMNENNIHSNRIFNKILFNESNNFEKENYSPPHTLEGSFEERYNSLREYFKLKRSQMNQNIIINGQDIKTLLYKIKDYNLYLNSTFILDSNDKFSLNDMVNKYFELMIEKNKINVINGKSIAISLKNNIDYELMGYILAILLIYPEYKIKYKLPNLICKLLINEKIDLNDIQYENKELYDKLIKIKREDDFSELEIYFIYDGDELISDGDKIKVDENNIEDYINKMIEYEIKKYKKEIEKIQDSVFQFVPKNYIFNFTGTELYQIINKFV
jgi:transcription elongation factor Elf1